jgi:hypothetical protein
MASKRGSVAEPAQKAKDIEKYSDEIFYSARYSGEFSAALSDALLLNPSFETDDEVSILI